VWKRHREAARKRRRLGLADLVGTQRVTAYVGPIHDLSVHQRQPPYSGTRQ
jgi:hypothetical protein